MVCANRRTTDRPIEVAVEHMDRVRIHTEQPGGIAARLVKYQHLQYIHTYIISSQNIILPGTGMNLSRLIGGRIPVGIPRCDGVRRRREEAELILRHGVQHIYTHICSRGVITDSIRGRMDSPDSFHSATMGWEEAAEAVSARWDLHHKIGQVRSGHSQTHTYIS